MAALSQWKALTIQMGHPVQIDKSSHERRFQCINETLQDSPEDILPSAVPGELREVDVVLHRGGLPEEGTARDLVGFYEASENL